MGRVTQSRIPPGKSFRIPLLLSILFLVGMFFIPPPPANVPDNLQPADHGRVIFSLWLSKERERIIYAADPATQCRKHGSYPPSGVASGSYIGSGGNTTITRDGKEYYAVGYLIASPSKREYVTCSTGDILVSESSLLDGSMVLILRGAGIFLVAVFLWYLLTADAKRRKLGITSDDEPRKRRRHN